MQRIQFQCAQRFSAHVRFWLIGTQPIPTDVGGRGLSLAAPWFWNTPRSKVWRCPQSNDRSASQVPHLAKQQSVSPKRKSNALKLRRS